jgi:hypothetical protein
MRGRTYSGRVVTALLVAAFGVAGAAACTSGDGGGTVTTPSPGGPSATATAGPSLSPSPTPPPTDPAIVFAADGIGKYVIGTPLSNLQGSTLISDLTESPHCTDAFGAKATGPYAGKLSLTFRGGKLTAIHTDSTSLVTPSGAKVGMALTEVQSIYAARATLINGTLGNKALSVRVPASTLAIVLYLDATNTKVAAMSAGDAQPLEDAARNGEGC